MQGLDAFPSLSWNLLGYTIAAAVMVGFDVWVFLQFFLRKEGTPTLSHAILTVFILVSSTTLWLSVLYDVLTGNNAIGVTAILFGVQVMMIAPFAWAFVVILRATEYHVDRASWGWPLTLGITIVLNEVLMGAVWVAWSGGAGALYAPGPWSWATVLSISVGTVWYFWSMSANMLPLVFWSKGPRVERAALLGLAATGLAGPWVVTSPLDGAVAMGVIMGLTLGAILWFGPSGPARVPVSGRFLYTVAAAFVAMLVGQAVLASFPTAPWAAVPFVGAMLVTMTGEVVYLSRELLAGLPLSSEEQQALAPIAEAVAPAP